MDTCKYGFCAIIHAIAQHLGYNKVNTMTLSQSAIGFAVIELLLKSSIRDLKSLAKRTVMTPRDVMERDIIAVSDKLKYIASLTNPQSGDTK